MHLIFVRHTRPAVAENVCYGMTDLELAPTFDDEAARVVGALPPTERLVTSPLGRCRRLAERIGIAQSLTPVIDARLREMDFGAWEGIPWSVIPRAELDAWAADFLHARPHGGESVHMLYERARSAIADYRATRLCHIVVTHAGVIKAVRAEDRHPNAWKSNVDFGGTISLADRLRAPDIRPTPNVEPCRITPSANPTYAAGGKPAGPG